MADDYGLGAYLSSPGWLTDYGSPAPSTIPVLADPNLPVKPSLLTSAWDTTKNFFTGKTADTAGMTDSQKAAAQTSKAITNAGILTSIFGAANQAIGSFYAAKSQQYQEKSAASSYAFQSDMAAINSRQAEYAAQATMEAGKAQIQQYSMAAGQEQAATSAEMAAHGVALGQGSARDVSASQALVEKMDTLTINSNATRQAWAQRMQGTNFANQAMLDRVSAQNAMAGARTISPFGMATTSLLSSASQFASQWDYRRKLQLQLGAQSPYSNYPSAYAPIGPGPGY